ncbi:MAG: response regulator [Treponemataceae bacterium]|nr:response regulator [Treponemataceae bacterium]
MAQRTFSILLVDDEQPALEGLEAGLHFEQLHITRIYKALSKDAALRILETCSIDLVVTDIEMPRGNGIELARVIKEQYPDAHVVFLTGHADFSYAQEALRLGIEDYILKPVSYPELESILERIEEKIQIEERTADFSGLAEEINSASPEKIIDQVKKIVAENISVGNLQRDEIAAMVHISPGYLSRVFKKETGMSLSDYIMQKRIAVAKQLLAKTGLSITAITERVGLNYSSYFTKIFKEQTGLTPQEYRNNSKKEKL